MNGDLGTGMVNLSRDFPAIFSLLQVIVMIVGLFMMYKAIGKMMDYSRNPGHEHGHSGFVSLVIGAFLLQFGYTMSGVFESISGSAGASGYVEQSLSYMPTTSAAGGVFAPVITACLGFVSLLGWFGGFKGFLIWNKASNGGGQGGGFDDPVWRGALHILGGALAINIVSTIEALRSSIGF